MLGPSGTPSAYRITVRRAGFHPPTFGGTPRFIFIGNIVLNAGLAYLIGFSFWQAVPVILFGAVQILFAAFHRKGPYYLQFLIRTTLRPLRHLER